MRACVCVCVCFGIEDYANFKKKPSFSKGEVILSDDWDVNDASTILRPCTVR